MNRQYLFVFALLSIFVYKQSQSQEFIKPVEAQPDVDTLIETNGKKLHARIHGQRAVGVVLINGFGATQNYWNHLIPDLNKGMGVLTYDRAGYGESETGNPEITIETSADDLHELLNNLEIHHPVIIVGHSYGGMIARKFVQKYPKSASGLILLDSSHELTKQKTLEILHGDDLELFNKFLTGPAMKFRWEGMTLEKKNMLISEQMLIDQPNLPTLPCTVLTAGNRPTYNGFTDDGRAALQNLDKELQAELGRRIPGTSYRVIPDGTHNLHVSNPAEVVSAILNLNPRFE